MHTLKQNFSRAFLTPIKSIKAHYVPLLLIYFAYGFQGITAITLTFWEKENLMLSTEDFVIIGTWLTMPWTLKMIFGQFVDHLPLFGSRRKSYIVLGASLMALGYLVLYGLMLKAPWVMWMGGEFVVYLTSSLLSVFGFVIQDVTADTMTVEVVDRDGKTEAEIKKEVTLVQILGRLSLMIAAVAAAFGTGKLAVLFQETPEKIALVALGIPVLSMIGAAFVNVHVESSTSKTSYDRVILGGGVLYAVFMLFMAFWGSHVVSDFSQEVTFFCSLILFCYLIHWMIRGEDPKRRRTIWYAFIAIFIFRAVPGTGPGFSWWAIDVLGFDREFLGLLRIISSLVPLFLLWLATDFLANKKLQPVLVFLIFAGTILSLPELGLYYGVHEMLGLSPRFVSIADTVLDSPLIHISMIPTLSLIAYFAPVHARGTWFAVGSSFMNLAITAGALGTKYLNQIFVVTREVLHEDGTILTPQNYDLLGSIMIWKIIIGFVVPLLAVFLFLRNEKSV